MTGIEQWVAAFLVGLLGGVHCVGMCGGIVGTLTLGLPREVRSSPPRLFPYQLTYNLGRVAGYVAAGALMGALGTFALALMPVQSAQRVLYAVAALFMILLGLYLGGWWPVLARLERLGARLWRRIEPIGRRLLPIRSPSQALLLGFVWAWIPCGLVYSVLIWCVSAGSATQGALLMLAFGLGTLPTLLGMGILAGAAARFADQVWVRRAAGALVLGFGFYALWQLFVL
jgi:sulfite exporter TauE/SafE